MPTQVRAIVRHGGENPHTNPHMLRTVARRSTLFRVPSATRILARLSGGRCPTSPGNAGRGRQKRGSACLSRRRPRTCIPGFVSAFEFSLPIARSACCLPARCKCEGRAHALQATSPRRASPSSASRRGLTHSDGPAAEIRGRVLSLKPTTPYFGNEDIGRWDLGRYSHRLAVLAATVSYPKVVHAWRRTALLCAARRTALLCAARPGLPLWWRAFARLPEATGKHL